MGHLTYEQSKRKAVVIISILGFITIFEVLFALLGKGYLVDGLHFPLMITGVVMIVLSLVKAYLIVYEFMHMKYEVPGLVKSVLLPTLLLVWAVIAFFYEGNGWNKSRNTLMDKYKAPPAEVEVGDVGFISEEIYHIG